MSAGQKKDPVNQGRHLGLLRLMSAHIIFPAPMRLCGGLLVTNRDNNKQQQERTEQVGVVCSGSSYCNMIPLWLSLTSLGGKRLTVRAVQRVCLFI